MKKCRTCKEEKELEEFYKLIKDDEVLHRRVCKGCFSKSRDTYRKANREHSIAYGTAYREANKEKIKALHVKYASENRTLLNYKMRLWRMAKKQLTEFKYNKDKKQRWLERQPEEKAYNY